MSSNLKELINGQIKGQVKLYLIQGDKKTLWKEINNSLDPANSKLIITRLMGGSNNWLNQISCYKAGLPLANRATTPTYPNPDEINLAARFEELDFNNTADEIRLENSSLGTFSSITGLSILKTNQYKLEIHWKLTINSL